MNENEIMDVETEEVMDTVTDSKENKDNGSIGIFVAGAVIAGIGAIATIAWKNRDKLEERRIEKLRKKGYIVYRPQVEAAEDEIVDDETNETEEE